MYTSDISQPNRCSQCWDMNFFHLYILRKLVTRFSQKHVFQTLHFICSFFRFYRAICLVFFWNMLIWVPTTQFCGKLGIHFSDIGNLFLERITLCCIFLLNLAPWLCIYLFSRVKLLIKIFCPKKYPKNFYVAVSESLFSGG